MPGNILLRSLSEPHYRRLIQDLTPVEMAFKKLLSSPGERVRFVYFPLTGVISVVSDLGGQIVEVATVGNEGFVGVPLFLGTERSTLTVVSQVPGHGLQLSAEQFKEHLRAIPELHRVLQLYTQAFIHQIAQSAACNRAHDIQQRCARWLLMTHDRVESDRFPLTQEFIGQMLGVRRPQVSKAAAALQQAGCIRYARGIVNITNRPGLEALACVCYRIVKDEYDRLLG